MKDYQQRVIDERIELFDKCEKLLNFINSAIYTQLPDADRSLLRRQLKVMIQYMDILNSRTLLHERKEKESEG